MNSEIDPSVHEMALPEHVRKINSDAFNAASTNNKKNVEANSLFDVTKLDLEDPEICQDDIIWYVPCFFDPDKVLGMNITETDDYINVYAKLNMKTLNTELWFTYCNNTTKDNDYDVDVKLSKIQEEQFKEVVFKSVYNIYKSYWNKTHDEGECASYNEFVNCELKDAEVLEEIIMVG